MKTVASGLGKRQKVRSIIFDRRRISRQELISLSGCNARSVTRYTDELCGQNLITATSEPGKRGRPSMVYRSRSEEAVFAGVTFLPGRVALVATNINVFPLAARQFSFQPDSIRGDLLKQAFASLDQMLDGLKGCALCAIGVSVAREWMRRDSKLGAEFLAASERRYKVPVELHDNDSLLLRRFAAQQMLSGKVGGVFVGSEFWMAAVEDGEIRDDVDSYLRKLRHWQIAPESKEECCCGRRGCLGAVLTYQGIISRCSRLSGAKPGKGSTSLNYHFIHTRALEGDKAALAVVRENGELLARAAARIRRDLKLDHMVLMHSNPMTRDFAEAAYRRETGGKEASLLNFKGFSADAIFAPAELMRDRLLNFDTTMERRHYEPRHAQ